MTWKEKVTPAGRHVCRLQVSARSTSDSDCGSWRSPAAQNAERGADDAIRRLEQGHTLNLQDPVTLASWPSPVVNDAKGSDYAYAQGNHDRPVLKLGGVAKLATWPTPRAEDSESTGAHRGTPDTLTSSARLANWATPSARDWKDSAGMSTSAANPDGSQRTRLDQLPRQANLTASLEHAVKFASGTPSSGSLAETGKPGQLNPAFSLWLMGYPTAWALCAGQVTRSSRKSQRK